ncbi:OmpW/AlkL family protein [Solimonas marina]|uniref:Outer membrane beta-barrel protein n=1 Tax=Solimonas marina TaxID=2714601 RepID=A0A969WA79_9GAMM|nr:OmpW family outer membrane protein [Solimonas marina]NKF21766.1 outer membrane beta-barrel protein [Solimonas marina]
MKKIAIAAAAATLLAATAAQADDSSNTQTSQNTAQTAGSWLFKAGVMSIIPDVSSSDLSSPSQPGTRVDVSSSSTRPAGGIAYMLTDNWSLEVPLAMPFSFNVKGDGTISGSGKIGDTKVLPMTLFVQYHLFKPDTTLRPFVGVGLTYAYFYSETGNGTLTGLTNPGGDDSTKLDIKSKFAPTPQLGLDWQMHNGWFAEAMLAKTFLKTKTTLSTGQTLDIRLDPWTAGVFVGYRF